MKLSCRIGKPSRLLDDGFEHLLSVIRQWKNAVDEIALFVDYSHHGYYPLEEYEAQAPVLRARMRDAGVPSVGINILCSIGHLDEGFDWLTRPPFSRRWWGTTEAHPPAAYVCARRKREMASWPG